jgi:hypothetical protein
MASNTDRTLQYINAVYIDPELRDVQTRQGRNIKRDERNRFQVFIAVSVRLWSSAVWLSTRAWRWGKYVLPKHWYQPARLHGATLKMEAAFSLKRWDYMVYQSRSPQSEVRRISNFSWIRCFTRRGRSISNTQKRRKKIITERTRVTIH